MHIIDLVIRIFLLIFIIVNFIEARNHDWYIGRIKQQIKFLKDQRRLSTEKHEHAIFEETITGLKNTFILNTKNSVLIFLSLIGLTLVNLFVLSSCIKLPIMFISFFSLFYVIYNKLTNSVKKNKLLGLFTLLYLPLIGIVYATQFMTIIEKNNKVSFTILLLTLSSILVSLFFSFSIASIVIPSKIVKFVYVSICFVGALF